MAASHGGQGGFGRGVLGHVRGLARGDAVVVLPRGLAGHQRGQLGLDLGLGQRVRDPLQRTHRRGPDLPVGGVPAGRGEHVPGDADAERGAGDPLRVQPVEHLAEPVPGRADEGIRADSDLVEVEGVLTLREHDVDRQQVLFEAGSVGGHDEQGKLFLAVISGWPGAGYDQESVGLVDPGDVVLGAGDQPVVAVADRGGGQLVGVRSGVRLGDGEHHLGAAVGQPGQVALALLVGAELGDHLGRDGRRDQQQEQRRALSGDLLADDLQLDQAASTAAVLLTDVHAEEPGLAQRLPQLRARLAARGVVGVVGRAEVPGDLGNRRAQGPVFVGFREVHDCSIEVIADSLGL